MLGDGLTDGVCEVVVDLVGVDEVELEVSLFVPQLVILSHVGVLSFLNQHLRPQFFQEMVGLVQQLLDLGVLCLLDLYDVLLEVVLLDQLNSPLLTFIQVLLLPALDVLVLYLGLVHSFLKHFLLLLVKLKELIVVLVELLDELFVLQLPLPLLV